MAEMDWQRLKGKFIVIDGPDGCGKSTQVRLLADVIEKQGVDVLTVRDPGGTEISEQIRLILLSNDNKNMSVRCEMLLYMASRAQLYSQCIGPALDSGKCVICDRWVSSTYAYQAVAGRVGAESVLSVAEAALERTWPDFTVIIDMPADVALERIGQSPDRMENKPIKFHQQVAEAFVQLADTHEDFKIIDGKETIDEVHKQICQTIEEFF